MEAQGGNACGPRAPRQEAGGSVKARDVKVRRPAGALRRLHREAPRPERLEELVQHAPQHVGVTGHQEQ
eukprot:10112099-Prorocentrum_lima.AAC.1